MPKIKVLAHEEVCPQGAEFDVAENANLCKELLNHKIEIEHACEMSCACSTCHVIIREGFHSIAEPSDMEDDLLDKAWGLTTNSRLSCQVKVGTKDLVVEIPKYTVNYAKEG